MECTKKQKTQHNASVRVDCTLHCTTKYMLIQLKKHLNNCATRVSMCERITGELRECSR